MHLSQKITKIRSEFEHLQAEIKEKDREIDTLKEIIEELRKSNLALLNRSLNYRAILEQK